MSLLRSAVLVLPVEDSGLGQGSTIAAFTASAVTMA